ncbi:hypothetical protein FB566_1764 [Stackebrandtia endophytica]|uniref:Peptidase C14 caspase domain-containing protein n=1 Tax=Stackebrandtia endophytica TaxID=1496996 RepID=A0A543AUM5_9ACTN|nr:caspase family protein [Stackebrandtia endophytica]TQL76241.1 hypothetical protein FB566_1764 [Stackebrandtia endophytica]
MPDALDGDYSSSRAILMGTWSYQHLDPVDAVERSFNRMHGLLRSPICGTWPDNRITLIADAPTVGDIRRELIASFLNVRDVALFYYVGHGLYDFEDRLHLTVQGSESAAAFRSATSLPFEAVREAFFHSKARTKIAILDCCYAGLAARPGGSLGVEGPLPNSGSYLMMSSSGYAQSWYELPDTSPKPQTYFTKYFVDTVESGIPGRPSTLTLMDLFESVSHQLEEADIPEPRSRSDDRAAGFAFARNKSAEAVSEATSPDELYAQAMQLQREGGAENLPTMKARFRTAAEQGHSRAMVQLGLIAEGRTLAELEGVPFKADADSDMATAVHWYTMASERGDDGAAFLLGHIHEEVYHEVDEALSWYQLAVNRGNSAARERLSRLRYRREHGLGHGRRERG